jgi:adenine-specific DNA-methyltransferase
VKKKQKLELTWIGKENRPRVEPRILLEDPEMSYHAHERVTENDLFDNRLIYGDNLLALKALEQEFTGKIKCIFMDPPYNTGSAFEHYEDNLEHSTWLSLMRDRVDLLRRLLSDDGSLWVVLNDEEAHYFKVLCDELFGRNCFVTTVVWKHSDNSNNNVKQFSEDHNYIIVYSRNPGWRPKFLNDPSKRKHFKNPDNDPRGPWFDGNPLNNPALRPNLQYPIMSPTGYEIPHPPNGWRWARDTLLEKISSGEIRFTPDGRGLRRRTYLADMEGLAPSSLWASIDDTGHTRQAKYELKALFPDRPVTSLFDTPKPEKVVQRVLELTTNPGDLVLDSFLGSGTTAAVAHKMGRRWIGIELGEHCHTHCLPRLKKVVDGTDLGGVTEAVGWKGGGGFRYFKLAPSLLEKDKWGQWVISKEFNAAMLAEAACKLEGFTYGPSDTLYWQHGHSTERDFIYVTTQHLGADQLAQLSDEVGPDRTLLVLCAAFRVAKSGTERYPNLTVKKIPKQVLSRCEWGHDDYSLKVENLPKAPTPPPKADKLRQHSLFETEVGQ